MKIIFRTFNCGAGDCLFLILQQKTGSYHIMIDCGALKNEVQSFVVDELGKRIDMLVITHIDNDHINGVGSLLDKIPDLQIGRILFNCYHRPIIGQSKEFTETQEILFHELKTRLRSSPIAGDGKVNAKEAISLSERILKNKSWAAAWCRSSVTAGMSINLPEGFGKITILSPLQEDLTKLETQFKKEFWAKFFNQYSNQYKDEEKIYEVLLRLWETTFVDECAGKVAYRKLTKESFIKAANEKVLPVNLNNRCSIAFVYEYKGHRLLLLGDAAPEIIVESLKRQIKSQAPYMMDLIKVSHHGSSHSTTSELIDVVDSAHYYFTGGNKEQRPSLETLSRIIVAPLKGQERRYLHFNRTNKVLKALFDMFELADFPCSIDLENNPYEIEI